MPPPSGQLVVAFCQRLPFTITVRESVREEECETKKIKTNSAKVVFVSPSFGLQSCHFPSVLWLVPVGGASFT